jgi:hypothetical protein
LSVVEIGRKIGVTQADLVEKPEMQFCNVVGWSLEVGLGLKGEREGNEFGISYPSENWFSRAAGQATDVGLDERRESWVGKKRMLSG